MSISRTKSDNISHRYSDYVLISLRNFSSKIALYGLWQPGFVSKISLGWLVEIFNFDDYIQFKGNCALFFKIILGMANNLMVKTEIFSFRV